MKTHEGVKEQIQTFLTLAADAGEYPFYRRLVEPHSTSKCSIENKNFLPCQESNSAAQPTADLYKDRVTAAPYRGIGPILTIYTFYHDKLFFFKFFF
jgi:hypothetical protein